MLSKFLNSYGLKVALFFLSLLSVIAVYLRSMGAIEEGLKNVQLQVASLQEVVKDFPRVKEMTEVTSKDLSHHLKVEEVEQAKFLGKVEATMQMQGTEISSINQRLATTSSDTKRIYELLITRK